MNSIIDMADMPLSERLTKYTHDAHDRLDSAVIGAASFDSVEGYGRFVQMQWAFHRDIDALYGNSVLRALLPELPTRRRLALIEADLADLELSPPAGVDGPIFRASDKEDAATALGWLYVAEGSNLGAALLRKRAMKIGLSDEFGARHLAPAPAGPAAHWRAFTEMLDNMQLSAEEQAAVAQGAAAAFARAEALANACLG